MRKPVSERTNMEAYEALLYKVAQGRKRYKLVCDMLDVLTECSAHTIVPDRIDELEARIKTTLARAKVNLPSSDVGVMFHLMSICQTSCDTGDRHVQRTCTASNVCGTSSSACVIRVKIRR